MLFQMLNDGGALLPTPSHSYIREYGRMKNWSTNFLKSHSRTSLNVIFFVRNQRLCLGQWDGGDSTLGREAQGCGEEERRKFTSEYSALVHIYLNGIQISIEKILFSSSASFSLINHLWRFRPLEKFWLDPRTQHWGTELESNAFFTLHSISRILTDA